ncbi:MAG: HrgA protein [Pseudomonadota bacterium]
MSLNLGKVVISFLQTHPDQKFTAREIAEWIFEKFSEECQSKKRNSQFINTDAELLNQLVGEIARERPQLQKKHPQIKITEGRPRQYYYTEKSDIAEIEQAEKIAVVISNNEKPKHSEHDLYPLLSSFLKQEFDVYSKRIDEKRSSNKQGINGNRWLHPDLVGMEDLGAEWHQAVRDCVNHYFDKRTKLWSFEVKLLINRSNVRECFFQTVSNSSWANFGYLVAAVIQGEDTLKELRMLFAAHGIGLIQLNVDNPLESQVLIPAREKDNIDWDMVNRLTYENKDFLDYVKLIKQFYQTGEVRETDWDGLIHHS